MKTRGKSAAKDANARESSVASYSRYFRVDSRPDFFSDLRFSAYICGTTSSRASEIDIPSLRIGADEFDAQLVANVDPLALDQQTFHMGIEYAHERAMFGYAGH